MNNHIAYESPLENERERINRHKIGCLINSDLLKFDCETCNVCLCKSRSNLFLEPTSRRERKEAVPLNERKCRACVNCLEDEFHVLFKYPLYDNRK